MTMIKTYKKYKLYGDRRTRTHSKVLTNKQAPPYHLSFRNIIATFTTHAVLFTVPLLLLFLLGITCDSGATPRTEKQ